MPQTLTESVDALARQAQDLRAELAAFRVEMTEQNDLQAETNRNIRLDIRRKTVTTRIALALGFVLLLCSVGAAFQVSLQNTRQIDANNQKFCPLVMILVTGPPRTTPAGIIMQKKAAEMARGLRCS